MLRHVNYQTFVLSWSNVCWEALSLLYLIRLCLKMCSSVPLMSLSTTRCPVPWLEAQFSLVLWTEVYVCLHPFIRIFSKKSAAAPFVWRRGHILCRLSRIPTMPRFFVFFFLWSAADLSRMCSLGVRLLCRQLGGVISVPFLGHWLCDVPSHWKPLGASHIPALPLQEKPATSPIKPPTTSYTHPPSDLEQSSCIQTSSLTLCTQSPRRCRGETRKDCFLIAGERKKGEGFWNI